MIKSNPNRIPRFSFSLLFFACGTSLALASPPKLPQRVVVTPEKAEYLVVLGSDSSKPTEQIIKLTVLDKKQKPVPHFCVRAKTDHSDVLLKPARLCSNRKGILEFSASSSSAVETQVSFYNDYGPKHPLRQLMTLTTVRFLARFSASASATTMYKNQCIQISAAGGVAPYVFQKVYDESNGTFDSDGNFCGGRGSSGNALLRVSDQRGDKAEFLITIITPPPGPVTIFYNREPLGEGQCVDLSASGNGGEWFTIVRDPSRGSLWNYGYSTAQFCAGSGAGIVEILVTDQDGMTDRAYIQALGAEIYGCTDPNATNFTPGATRDDGSCLYENSPF